MIATATLLLPRETITVSPGFGSPAIFVFAFTFTVTSLPFDVITHDAAPMLFTVPRSIENDGGAKPESTLTLLATSVPPDALASTMTICPGMMSPSVIGANVSRPENFVDDVVL